MTAPIAFIDTETTGIHPGRRAWEVAIIRREPDGTEQTLHAFIRDVDLSAADPYGLRVGRFYERHPSFNSTLDDALAADPWRGHNTSEMPPTACLIPEFEAAWKVERMTRGAHLAGCVPNFDAEVFADMLRRHQLTPAWHYHLVDVENLAVGYLSALDMVERKEFGKATKHPALTLPWSSEDLSRACGVEPAGEDERHTALGDAKWAMRLYDVITGQAVTTDA